MLQGDSGRVMVQGFLALWEGCWCHRGLLKFPLNGCFKTFKHEFGAFFFFGILFSSLTGGTPGHKNLGRLLSTLKVWKQEGNFGLCLQKKSPTQVVSEFLVYPRPPCLLWGEMWEGGKEESGQPSGIYRLGLAPSQGDKPSVARVGKGAAHPALP